MNYTLAVHVSFSGANLEAIYMSPPPLEQRVNTQISRFLVSTMNYANSVLRKAKECCWVEPFCIHEVTMWKHRLLKSIIQVCFFLYFFLYVLCCVVLCLYKAITYALLAPPSGALVVSQFQDLSHPIRLTFRFGCSNLP